MHYRILKLLTFFVLAGLAHGAYVQVANSRYGNKANNESPNQYRIMVLQEHLFSSTHAPLLLVGSSMTGLIPTAAFRVPAENMGMAMGSRTVFKMLSEQQTLPSLILVEANVILMDEEDLLIKRAKATMNLRQYQQRFRPTVMLLTEYNNLIDMALPDPEMIKNSGQALSYAAIIEERIQKTIEQSQGTLSSNRIKNGVALIKQRIDQFIKRGASVVLVEMPMDPRVRATPRFAPVLSAMHAAFPADQYQWLTPRPSHLKTLDGIHLSPQSAEKTAKVIDQSIMSLGLYQKLGLLPAQGNAGT